MIPEGSSPPRYEISFVCGICGNCGDAPDDCDATGDAGSAMLRLSVEELGSRLFELARESCSVCGGAMSIRCRRGDGD